MYISQLPFQRGDNWGGAYSLAGVAASAVGPYSRSPSSGTVCRAGFAIRGGICYAISVFAFLVDAENHLI